VVFSPSRRALLPPISPPETGQPRCCEPALYGMIHATALISVTVMAEAGSRLKYPLLAAGWSFAAGMFLFSFSLFGLALTGIEWLGLTPIGGAGFLVGWAALGLHAFDRAR
jgi:uncharacterized membrane protein YgdD (TMEM256/DUF423 family)